MSMHDELQALVADAKGEYKMRLATIKNIMAKLREWLPTHLGGAAKDYTLFHPTENDERRKDDLSLVLPEKGGTFALGLAIKANGVTFAYFLRMKNITKEAVDVQLIGSDKTHRLPSDQGVKSLCKQLFDAAKQALADQGLRESSKTLAVNQYE